MATEKEKMLQGRLYSAFDPELAEERTKCRKLVAEYNSTHGESIVPSNSPASSRPTADDKAALCMKCYELLMSSRFMVHHALTYANCVKWIHGYEYIDALQLSCGSTVSCVRLPSHTALKLGCADDCELWFWAADEQERRTQILKKLLGRIDEENPPYIEPPFTLDYVRL